MRQAGEMEQFPPEQPKVWQGERNSSSPSLTQGTQIQWLSKANSDRCHSHKQLSLGLFYFP